MDGIIFLVLSVNYRFMILRANKVKYIGRLASLLVLHFIGFTSFSQEAHEQDSSQVTVAGNPDLKGNGLKRTFIGQNYRQEWTQPLQVRVLHLSDLGWKATKEGGGKQTRSLKVEDANGKEYSIRSIEKYPEKAIPDEFKHTLAEKIIVDGISASYPYGSLSMKPFSTAANVPYYNNTLIFLADDPALGEFRSKYKNMLALLEPEAPVGVAQMKEKENDK